MSVERLFCLPALSTEIDVVEAQMTVSRETGLSFQHSCDRIEFCRQLLRRHLRFHQMATYYFYPVKNFHEIEGFWTTSPKPEVIEGNTLGVRCYVPLALSNGIWNGAIGLPVSAGHREVCLFFILFVPLSFANVYRPQF
jgi:hypothetical protein